MLQRDPHSHKGENGKVAVIGGSLHQHGAPLFSALAAEAGGVDLLYVCLPLCHAEIAKAQSLNFQVHPFAGDELSTKDVQPILELLATMDCAVIGPGLSRTPSALKALRDIIAAAPCPLVLDASALQLGIIEAVQGRGCVLTPHAGELERMGITHDDLEAIAKEYGVTILCKGSTDRIASPDGRIIEVAGGNPGLTVGGTGDALAGLIAGLMAQHIAAPEACRIASAVMKAAGEELQKSQGFAYTTRDCITLIPKHLRSASASEQSPR